MAAKLGLDTQTVGKWQRRFVKRRVAGLHDEPRSGAPRTSDDARIEAVVVRTLEKCPRERHPLEFARHGERQRPVGVDGARHLASLRLGAVWMKSPKSRRWACWNTHRGSVVIQASGGTIRF
ncbi:hypothetical protein [Bradyrhizobium sp. sBnM-33]|uniref:hypothetical protein n=1 Tax=Bradyrhizobium sp. sBnM-33 TaxID=2831780 RepID=UPI00289F8D8B|nr:hypothetical protein [Bradyrhizobium sp. sBnM-33]WOH54510.1 hypothetical protein RX328_12715 [Bradyrhizobium sp. sBnM-33]